MAKSAVLWSLLLLGCTTAPPSAEKTTATATDTVSRPSALASVTAVEVSGEQGSYIFEVTIASKETGCDRYANWWEVIDTEGNLIYRRILQHSHVNEQPFARSGGPVAVEPAQRVIVRAHMEPTGYGTDAMAGTAADGFEPAVLEENFAIALAQEQPLPTECAF